MRELEKMHSGFVGNIAVSNVFDAEVFEINILFLKN